MLHTRRKAEIEIITSTKISFASDHPQDLDPCSRLEEPLCSTPTTSLLYYLTSKISGFIASRAQLA